MKPNKNLSRLVFEAKKKWEKTGRLPNGEEWQPEAEGKVNEKWKRWTRENKK